MRALQLLQPCGLLWKGLCCGRREDCRWAACPWSWSRRSAPWWRSSAQHGASSREQRRRSYSPLRQRRRTMRTNCRAELGAWSPWTARSTRTSPGFKRRWVGSTRQTTCASLRRPAAERASLLRSWRCLRMALPWPASCRRRATCRWAPCMLPGAFVDTASVRGCWPRWRGASPRASISQRPRWCGCLTRRLSAFTCAPGGSRRPRPWRG
mmetsp:Transcript_5246/g.15536  ORF Transcript_5246/g.15536 Transcript_5246/m.15536 type:complete len:210 (+) Transcript_5246:183-812(+)